MWYLDFYFKMENMGKCKFIYVNYTAKIVFMVILRKYIIYFIFSNPEPACLQAPKSNYWLYNYNLLSLLNFLAHIKIIIAVAIRKPERNIDGLPMSK